MVINLIHGQRAKCVLPIGGPIQSGPYVDRPEWIANTASESLHNFDPFQLRR
jgi:hypothetical protein